LVKTQNQGSSKTRVVTI